MSRQISRRTILRGLGTALALPALEAMAPARASAAAAAAPLRTAYFFVPNGIHMADWKPSAIGSNWELPYTLQPLAKVKSKLNVLSGLTHDKARANGDGPGDHARSTSAYLTGCQPRKTDGGDIRAGVSVDQLAAAQIGDRTRFASLEIGIERGAQAGNCDSGYSCAYSSAISWRGPSTPVAKEVDPRLVFERLFSTGERKETAESLARRNLYRQSILDLVMDDAKALQQKLGSRDQQKLDEYFTGIREIEKRLELAQNETLDLSGMKKPEGIPQDMGEHIRLLGDIMVLAFQSDLTRICSFMIANDGSNRPYPNLSISDGHHDLSHHQGDEQKQTKIREINRFHVQQLAYILEKLDSIKEGSGTLLDNTLLVYGAGISDGNRHNHDDLPVLLAGRGGGRVKTGRHIEYPFNTPMCNLFLSMLDLQGVQEERFGDSTGRLTNLG